VREYINPGVTVDNNSSIASDTVVTEETPENVVVLGNPTTVMKGHNDGATVTFTRSTRPIKLYVKQSKEPYYNHPLYSASTTYQLQRVPTESIDSHFSTTALQTHQ